VGVTKVFKPYVVRYYMPKVIVREKAHFRIEIRDLRTGKSKTVSLVNHDKKSVEDIKALVVDCFNKQ
jgi:hypothetical protein